MDNSRQTEFFDRIVAHVDSGVDPMVPDVMRHPVDFRRERERLMNIMLNEDFVVARAMQGNLASGARTHAVFGRQEVALQHYHRVLARELADDGVAVANPERAGVPA